jgi:hypothetical protein
MHRWYYQEDVRGKKGGKDSVVNYSAATLMQVYLMLIWDMF